MSRPLAQPSDAAALRRARRRLSRTAARPEVRLVGIVAAVVAIHMLRLAAGSKPGTGISFLLVVPVVMLAVERGVRVGVAAGLAGYGLIVVWVISDELVGLDVTGHIVRAGILCASGAAAGWSADRLRSAASRQQHMADALGDMVSAHDPDGRYRYASAAAKSLLGYDPDELVGTSVHDHFHPHDAREARSTHDSTLSSSDVQTAVHRVRRADGRYVWLETVSRAIRARGEVVEILCSSRDVTRRETERLAIEEDLRHLRDQIERVLATRGIEPVFQPLKRLDTRETIGFEALARFPLIPSRPPNIWFEHAAQVGLIKELELLAIERALEAFDLLPPTAFLSINASPNTLCAPEVMDIVRAVPAKRLILELTEHAEIDDYPGFNDAVKDLRGLGVRLAVDDAGAGFASLRHILDVRPELIKLDISLTRNIGRDPARRALASALCDFAASLDAEVIAEGIEDEHELAELLALGIRSGQGYLLGKPADLPGADKSAEGP
jgi:PAS domain S-box-containing protein